MNSIESRLNYLRDEILAERISYGETVELQSLSEYISKDDMVLLEWLEVPESEEYQEDTSNDSE